MERTKSTAEDVIEQPRTIAIISITLLLASMAALNLGAVKVANAQDASEIVITGMTSGIIGAGSIFVQASFSTATSSGTGVLTGSLNGAQVQGTLSISGTEACGSPPQSFNVALFGTVVRGDFAGQTVNANTCLTITPPPQVVALTIGSTYFGIGPGRIVQS